MNRSRLMTLPQRVIVDQLKTDGFNAPDPASKSWLLPLEWRIA